MQRVDPLSFLNFQFVEKKTKKDALVIKFSKILNAKKLKACLVSSSSACKVELEKMKRPFALTWVRFRYNRFIEQTEQ